MSISERRPAALPAGLRQRVLIASEQARAAGRSVPDVNAISPIEAFRRAADAFHTVLCAVARNEWHVAVVNQFDVQGLVGHLIGVERDFQLCLEGDPTVADVEHVDSTRSVANGQVGVPPARTRTEWRRATEHTIALVESTDLDTEVGLHGLKASTGTLLVVRAFELWTHENDIRTALGLPPSSPDGATLRLMTTVAAGALPLGAARVGLREPTHVRLVLTGNGGGTWDIAVGGKAPDAVAIRIVADAVAFCRLAANRITPDELDLHLTGDADRADAVLGAVAALALD
jgi:uncharacterized protein (TIGR03083 family)